MNMPSSRTQVVVPIVVALIGLIGVLGVPLITKSVSSENEPSNPNNTKPLQCNINTTPKICVESVTLQINADEPLKVYNHTRIPMKAGDNLKLLTVSYCIPSKVSLNTLQANAYLWHNGVQNNHPDVVSTPTNFPINTGVCHTVGNFTKVLPIQAGQHQLMIAVTKGDGSNKSVEKSFYLTLDVGQ